MADDVSSSVSQHEGNKEEGAQQRGSLLFGPWPHRGTRASFLILFLFYFFSGVEYAVILPSLNLYIQDLGMHHHYFLGIVLSLFSVASMLSSPFYGKWADQGSIRSIMLFSNLFQIAGNAMYFLANDPYILLEGRFIAGLGAGSEPAIYSYLGRITKEKDRTYVMGVMMSARQFGLLIGPGLNFGLDRLHVHFGPFTITNTNYPGFFMVFIWILVQFGLAVFLKNVDNINGLVEPVSPVKSSNDASQGGGGIININEPEHEDEDVLSDASPLLQNGKRPKVSRMPSLVWTIPAAVYVLLVFEFVVYFNQFAIETIVTPMTQKFFDWHVNNNSLMYITIGLEMVLVFIIVQQLTHRLTDRMLVLVGALFVFAGFLWMLIFIAPSPVSAKHKNFYNFIISTFLLVFGLPFLFTPLPSILSKLVPYKIQGQALGLQSAFTSIGTILGPFVAGLLVDHLLVFFGLVVGLLLLVTILFLRFFSHFKFDSS